MVYLFALPDDCKHLVHQGGAQSQGMKAFCVGKPKDCHRLPVLLQKDSHRSSPTTTLHRQTGWRLFEIQVVRRVVGYTASCLLKAGSLYQQRLLLSSCEIYPTFPKNTISQCDLYLNLAEKYLMAGKTLVNKSRSRWCCYNNRLHYYSLSLGKPWLDQDPHGVLWISQEGALMTPHESIRAAAQPARCQVPLRNRH